VSVDGAFHFSVVIPTYQRRDVVLGSLQALGRQRGAGRFEVVVVVDGSTDGTAEALRELETPFPLTVIEQDNQGGAAARNRGVAAARGELVLLLDDDMEADPGLLAQHDRAHRQGADVVIGHIPLHPESRPGFLSKAVGEWAERRAASLRERGGELEIGDLLSGQMSLRREVFIGIGGFDTSFTTGGEDLDLGRRLQKAGCRIVFDPEAISRQRYVVTPRHYLRQWRVSGQAAVMLARRHPDQADRVFRYHETTFDRLFGRPLRGFFREIILAVVATGIQSDRITRWFFRVRNLERFRGIRDAGGRPVPRPVRVLCYHSIADLAGAPIIESYGIPPREFRRQLDFLSRHFRLISPDEFRRFLAGAGVPRRAVLVTFDDCFRDLLETALPLLREFQVPALAFAVTGKLGATNDWDAPMGAPQLPLLGAEGLRTLAEENVVIGSHTRTHRMLNRLSDDELASEIEGSIADLEALGLPRPSFLAYPHGEHSSAVERAAIAAGLVGAFTVEGGRVHPGCDPYAIPRTEVLLLDTGWRFVWRAFTARRSPRSRKRLRNVGARMRGRG
jgi:glycosyltransferase involved in cell wall biosynthesis